jgi:hypothetical protein
MPLHVFIAQSASLLTGGIGAWKAAKDIFVIPLPRFFLPFSDRIAVLLVSVGDT